MEVEKQSSKGGFLQLFDWNLKSRKKLFSNKSEVSENVKEGKDNGCGLAISQFQQVQENEGGPSKRGYHDLHYRGVSSSSEDEGYGTRAPGVVARLMGLDLLPTSNVAEHYSTVSFEPQSFRDSYYLRRVTNFQNEQHVVIYGSMRNKLDGMVKNPSELMLQKGQSRPMERFQTEVLPPKSAKPISITHSKLLSPIKSPGFIPPKNAAYIMEAAAKIIEQSPRSTVKSKLSSVGSSSVPLRIQELRGKVEAAQKTSRVTEVSNKHKPTKHIRRQMSEKGDLHLVKASESSKVGSQGLRTKEKSASLAVQAENNTEKRERSTAVGKRRVNQKEHSETKPSYVSKNHPNLRKTTETRTSSSRSSDVLRQNNQKQNCMSSKDRESLKPSNSCQKDSNVMSTSDSTRSRKVNKIVLDPSVGSRKTNSMVIDSKKDSSECRKKKFPRKKQPVNANVHTERSACNSLPTSKDERAVKCNIAIEGRCNWDAVDRKTGLDVVSFTFTSPIKRSLPGSNSSAQAVEKNNTLILTSGDNDSSSKCSTASSSGFNLVGGDALSVLLEQKLQELSSRVELSHQDEEVVSNSTNSFQDSVTTLNTMHERLVHTKALHLDLPLEDADVKCNLGCSNLDDLKLKATHNCQISEGTGELTSGSDHVYEQEFDLRYYSSVVEPSISEASCNSLDSKRSFSSEVSDSKWCTSVEADNVSDCSSVRPSQVLDSDLELADSASSTSLGAMRRKDTATLLTYTNFEGFHLWELEYIRNIISNADLMFEEFALGQVHRVMEPNMFDQLESRIMDSNKNAEEPFKIARKALFDCVEECLEVKCNRSFCGSFRAWAKWMSVFQSTDRLAEDIYREVFGWTNMVDLMVDELVEKDMSSQLGRWVEFETETFEEGIEIQNDILSSLVDELIDDLLLL